MLEDLIDIHNNVIKNTPEKIKRYLYDEVRWNSKAICITGARGVGKTTMLLQYYHEKYGSSEKCLYMNQ